MEVAVDLLRMRDSSDTGPAPSKKTPPPSRGNNRREREYKRDKDGQFNEVDERGGGGRGRGGRAGRRPMTEQERHVAHVKHVKRVKALQQLLNKLGYKVTVDGKMGPETKRIVNDLQRKLGLPLTNQAVSGRLMRRLRDVEIISPCAKGAKRSKEMDELDELIRAVGLVDEECDCEDKDNCDCEEDDEDESTSYRAQLLRCCPNEHTFDRVWPLDDIEIVRSAQGGDGRTVVAYAAPFGVPTEIKDQHGHYMETIDRAAFNEAIAEGIHKVGVFYHHGMTLHGTPSDLGSVPIGSPLEIRADGKGLLTRTRYNKTELAESVLQAIKDGDLKGYSFRGAIRQSEPRRIARARTGAPLPTVTRMKLGLNEYGPTPTPYYADAKILAVRSAQTLATQLVDPDFRRELITILSRSPLPLDQEQEYDNTAPPETGPGAEDQPQEALRSAPTQADIRRRIAVWKITGGKK